MNSEGDVVVIIAVARKKTNVSFEKKSPSTEEEKGRGSGIVKSTRCSLWSPLL
jgi:hypothetical protein